MNLLSRYPLTANFLLISLLLAGMAWVWIPWARDHSGKSPEAAKNRIAHINWAVGLYQLAHGELPPLPEVMFAQALCGENPTNTHYLDADIGFLDEKGVLLDPWGNHFKIEYTGQEGMIQLVIESAGPDGVWGNDDDISRQSRYP